MRPTLKILIIEDDAALLSQIVENITKTIVTFERQDIDIVVLEADNVRSALEAVRNDGDIQAVVFSWDVSTNWREIDVDRSGKVDNNAVVIDAIKHIRHELPVYVLGDAERGLEIVNDTRAMESFFYRNDIISDPESILGYIINDYDDRCDTPFWTAYRKYVVEANDSWHTPGHSGGASFRNSSYIKDFYDFFGRNVFVSDLSVSVDSLGSLSDSTNAIRRAQEAVAYTFDVRKSYFVTNGSSTSNKIVLQTLLRPGDKAIIDRNCHKSVHYGVVQSYAMPIYLDSILNPQYGIFAPPSLENISAAIDENPDAKLLVLTGCTYDGLLIDLEQVVQKAHAHNIKVFIDEAWFAYASFHPRFRHYSAINSGADYVTHSAHKVVSAFSQASYIHINDPEFDQDYFKEIYNIYVSTSPKYQLIASLDVCRKQLEMEGYKILNTLLRNVEELKQQVSRFKRIRILGPEDFAKMFSHFESNNMGHDPLKILIDISALEYSNQEIHRYLMDEVGLEIEKFTHSTLLVLLTLGGMRSKMVRLYNALKKLDDGKVSLIRSRSKHRLPDGIPPINLACLPSEAFFGRRESIPLQEAVGRIACALVTPYPPGIPLLVPGQRIEEAHLSYLKALSTQKLTIQGMFDGDIYVLANPEQQIENSQTEA
ncbi:aminotransferase class V-fold PLP-dependent enzyme [Allohahella sp. A8]|uniref:aminotransferase class V-fold PLP-dependent enzyme n=1 Tax=Allohahella sp. A8 TaxID=3141461 RepID=UPI000C09E8D7|nr:amino acid decarboxylase [Hahellaceae bacterium]|tara:strand:+ start:23757 stop:25718 length:1962 start_codon:yes stop_codon:yes gene_type:complete